MVERRSEEQLRAGKAETQELQKQKEELFKSLESVKARLATSGQTLWEREQQLLELQRAVEQLDKRYAQQSVEMDELRKSLEHAQRQVSLAEQQLKDAEARCAEPIQGVRDLNQKMREVL